MRPIPQGSQPAPRIGDLTAPAGDIEAFAREVMGELPVRSAPQPAHEPSRPLLAAPPGEAAHTAALVDELNWYLRSEDFSSALIVADEILEIDPKHLLAKQSSLRCQAALELVYIRRLGPLSQVPVVAVAKANIRRLALDHRSGFILALVDGVSTLDMILDMSSGMRRLEALRLLLELVQQGIVELF